MILRRCLVGLLSLTLAASAFSAEFRGAWVASVVNINFPSRAGLSPEAQQAQIHQIVQTASRTGLNALMVQVRPEGDALYKSRLEPWSRYLTGRQGEDPGYDPLAIFLSEGRRYGISIYAWVNPYRAAIHADQTRAASHEANSLGSSVHRIGGALWLDPGDPRVRAHVVSVVRDIVGHYPVAGVVLDDYFYPYPGPGHSRGEFPDTQTYNRYRSAGGDLSLAEWRRQNVNELIEDLHSTIRSTRPHASFGVSPFGIYTHGQPADVRVELDQYRDLYSDPVKWMKQGWVDYLSPQLYWRDGSPQSYSALLRWWRSPEANPNSVPIYPSIALERLGEGYNWPSTEIARQLSLEQVIKPRSGGGFILWNIGQLVRNQKNVGSIVADAQERVAGK